MRPGWVSSLSVLTGALVLSLSLAACSGSSDDSGADGDTTAVTSAEQGATVADVVELRPLWTSDGRIVDDLDRDVLLRGANVNSLAEYWQGVPEIDTTIPVTDADWDAMAARGFSVVRLLVSWSRVEPERDQIDKEYLDLVDEHVEQAKARGIYTVIDMHQDAYSAFIHTTDAGECVGGTTPAKGWDGAPEWATITDGESTCLTNGDRNSSPAVTRAWNNFYDDRDGIRSEFTEAWAAIAGRFAGRAEVAGFDILNEPDTSAPAAELTPKYEALLGETITAIREAQAGAPFRHIAFVEPALPAGHRENGLVIPDPARIGLGADGVVASVHNYSESIDNGMGLSIEAMNGLISDFTSGMGIPDWGGEYGFWNTEPATLEKAERYAADEDARLWGGAWWQWRQSCGDPHAVQWVDGEVVAPTGESIQLNRLACPDNTDLGPTEEFLRLVGRGYPRAAPGRLTEVVSDPDAGTLSVTAEAGADDVGNELVVWLPTGGEEDVEVTVVGLDDVERRAVPGGRLIVATVAAAGEYSIQIG